jgi:hypothetical protein
MTAPRRLVGCLNCTVTCAFLLAVAAADAASSEHCRGPVALVNRFLLAGSLSLISDTSFFGDVLTQSLGLVGWIVHVTCG